MHAHLDETCYAFFTLVIGIAGTALLVAVLSAAI